MATKPDKNYRSYANQSIKLVRETISPLADGVDDSDINDILKFSNCENSMAVDCMVHGEHNKEDAVDINRGQHILFVGGKYGTGGKYDFTIKGGAHDVVLMDVVITRPGKWVDIDLGNHSDQSYDVTHTVVLQNVTREDGKPVRVRVGRAKKPLVHGGNVKILTWQSWLLKAYVFLKHYIKFIP